MADDAPACPMCAAHAAGAGEPCCPEHCCDWDDCACGDCELCMGEDAGCPTARPSEADQTGTVTLHTERRATAAVGALVINGAEAGVARGTGIRGIRWLRENDVAA